MDGRVVHFCSFSSRWCSSSSSDGSWGMLFWHILMMRRTPSDHRERICSHSGWLVKLSTFNDTSTLTGESKGQGHLVGESAITGSTWHLLDDCKKSGQIYARPGDCVSAWFECEKPGGRCLLLTFHHQVYRRHHHHHHLFLLKPPSAITPKSSAIISDTDDLCWPLMCARIHPPSTAVAFPLFCCKICDEKLYSTRQLSWYYILRSLFLLNHRA